MAVAMFSSVNSQSIAFSIVTRDDDDKAGEILHTLKSGKHLDMIVKKYAMRLELPRPANVLKVWIVGSLVRTAPTEPCVWFLPRCRKPAQVSHRASPFV
jgi:hypothetical protein